MLETTFCLKAAGEGANLKIINQIQLYRKCIVIFFINFVPTLIITLGIKKV